MPNGHDPQSITDLDWLELRLGQLHPVFFGDLFQVDVGQIVKADFPRRGRDAADQIMGRLEHRNNFAVGPERCGRAARFAELRRFVLSTGVGIFYADR